MIHPSEPSVPAPGDPSRPRSNVIVGLCAAVAVAALSVVFIYDQETAPPAVAAPQTSTSTSTVAPTTTIEALPVVDRWTTTVATVTAGSIDVAAEVLDPTFATDVGARVRARQATEAGWAAYTAPPTGQVPIPTIEHPIDGREATATGWRLANPTGWGGPLVLTVTEDHGEWLRVMVPVRPNGTEGWIRRSEVTLRTTRFHVTIDVAARMLHAFDGDKEVLTTQVVVGKDSTPTPRGRLFITDHVEKYAGSSYGPWILALSGYSLAMDDFAGGAPVLAIHGTNRPGLAGTAASNGCIRVPSDDAIRLLRQTLPTGTPVDIV